MKKETINKLEKIVEESYQKTASHFALTRNKELWPTLSAYLEAVQEKSSVLDIACGNGRILNALQEKQVDYFGCDQSSNLIKIAQSNWPQHSFTVSSLPNLEELKPREYDYIFLIAALHHLPSYQQRLLALKNIKKYLKKDGRLIISVWRLLKTKKRQAFWQWFKSLFNQRIEYGDVVFPWKSAKGDIIANRYYHGFSRRELHKVAKEAGYKIGELKQDEYNYWIVLNK
jgi:2-polyprenyl-3-methyl-5-hydroxy-6-metoxy-1,4-benzoquinol methylase